MTTLDGRRIGLGDLLQRSSKGVISSRLVLNFSDGSVDDETTVYTQDRVLRLVTDHHVQHGRSFPKPVDVLIDAAHGAVRYKDNSGTAKEVHIDMPADVYNGMASTVLMNLPQGTSEAAIAIVIAGAKPRIAHLKSILNSRGGTSVRGRPPMASPASERGGALISDRFRLARRT